MFLKEFVDGSLMLNWALNLGLNKRTTVFLKPILTKPTQPRSCLGLGCSFCLGCLCTRVGCGSPLVLIFKKMIFLGVSKHILHAIAWSIKFPQGNAFSHIQEFCFCSYTVFNWGQKKGHIDNRDPSWKFLDMWKSIPRRKHIYWSCNGMQYVFGISQKYLPYFLGKMEKLGASKNWQRQASLACIALALPPPNPVASYNAPRRPIVRVRGCVYI